MTRAVVFAYHDVGVRCLKTVLARGVDVALVVTHQDDPKENIWFQSVAAVAEEAGIEVVTPGVEELPQLALRLEAIKPDLLLSFYYRFMLPEALLQVARQGAFNMHGSLLPKYRGRVPINWAVLHGESETGATLHEMTVKPDAGAIIDQQSVPILPDDTALEVFRKVTVAAEQTLWRALPHLMAGDAVRHDNRLTEGSYFGGRRAEDGRIDWNKPRAQVYNLIRAVAPPYPGAFCSVAGHQLTVDEARPTAASGASDGPKTPGLLLRDNRLLGVCGDGQALWLKRVRLDGAPFQPEALRAYLESP